MSIIVMTLLVDQVSLLISRPGISRITLYSDLKWPNEDNEILSIEQMEQYDLVDGGKLYDITYMFRFTICKFTAGSGL